MANVEELNELTDASPLVDAVNGVLTSPTQSDSRRVLRCITKQGRQPSLLFQRFGLAASVLSMLVVCMLCAFVGWGHVWNSSASRPMDAANANAGQHLLRRPRAGASSGEVLADGSVYEMKEVIFKNFTAAHEASESVVDPLDRVLEKKGKETLAEAEDDAAKAKKSAGGNTTKDSVAENTTTKAPPKIVPLFCWALITPWGYERGLVTWQHEHKAGIFGCDDWAVYSNETLDFGGAFQNKIVHTKLKAPVGGQWNTLLNTPIFLATWKQVLKDGQFWLAEWTVKVDADAVLFPERLRGLVKAPGHEHPQWGNGMFADNCGYTRSMHGPIELFSRRALVVWNKRMSECKQPPQEDVFMRECMLQLGATELRDYNLLAEQSCFWDWWNCQSQHVAFHPFKKLDDYRGCMERSKHPTPPLPR